MNLPSLMPDTDGPIDLAAELEAARETTRLFGTVFAATRDVEGFARVVFALERLLGRPIVLGADNPEETVFCRSVAARVVQLLADPPQLAGAPMPLALGPLAELADKVAAVQFVREWYREHSRFPHPAEALRSWFKPLPLPFEKSIGEGGTTILEWKIPKRGKLRRRSR